jgi:formylglycine-generating enzyme required for sulfatase activity
MSVARRLSPLLTAPPPAPQVTPWQLMKPLPPVFPFDWAVAYGEDEFGLWQAFEIEAATAVRQTLRWIPPGTFLMGSPEDEAERWAEAEQQHLVTLHSGFWLADTACTQALWTAVMGDNPSRFSEDAENPVERVSWDDITQNFLPALNQRLPGLDLELPSEAKWEYACRAGTTTPFWFGKQITTEQVNYNGNYPNDGGAKGPYRERTVRVKTLPANGWGIFEMHGNVLEWCGDEWVEKNSADVAEDQVTKAHSAPRGPALRVLRGGSYLGNARHCRGAFRHADQPGNRLEYFGFRLARAGS